MANSLTVPNLGPTAAAAPSLELPARIANIATTVLNDILILAAVIAVFFIIYGGYNYISSGGDATKAKTAQATILNSVIGIIVIASAFGLVNLATRVGLSLKAGNDSHLAIDSSQNTDKINVHSTQVGPISSSTKKDTSQDNDGISTTSDTRTDQQKFVSVLQQCAKLNEFKQRHNTTCRDYFMSEGETQFNKACIDSPELKTNYFYCKFDFATAKQELIKADLNPTV